MDLPKYILAEIEELNHPSIHPDRVDFEDEWFLMIQGVEPFEQFVWEMFLDIDNLNLTPEQRVMKEIDDYIYECAL